MRRSRFSEDQIAMALRQADAGTPVAEICRKLEISETTFLRRKKKSGGLGVPELRELGQPVPGAVPIREVSAGSPPPAFARTRREPGELGISAAHHPAPARRLAGQSQSGVSALPRGRTDAQAETAEAAEERRSSRGPVRSAGRP